MITIRMSRNNGLTLGVLLASLLILIVGVLDNLGPAKDFNGEGASPYVYYFSNTARAWIIERADGTQRREFGGGVMQDRENTVTAVHWSPSGAYLAWGSQYRDAEPNYKSTKARIARIDGAPMGPLVDGMHDLAGMAWIPGQDWLLVQFVGPAPEWDTIVRLIDVPNQRVLYEYVASQEYPEPYSVGLIGYSSDGSSLYFWGGGPVLFSSDGSIQAWNLPTVPYTDVSSDRMITSRYVYNTENQPYRYYRELRFVDLLSDETHLYKSIPEDVESDGFRYRVVWNADRSFALIEEHENCGEHHCYFSVLVLYEWETGTRYLLGNQYRMAVNTGNPVPWAYVGDMWSPDGRVVMVYDNEMDLNLFVVDTQTREVVPVNHDPAMFQWLNDHDLWVMAHDVIDGQTRYTTYDFDWQNQRAVELTHVSLNLGVYSRPPLIRFSPDNTYVAFDHHDASVQNILTGEVFTFPRHQEFKEAGIVTEYKWHESNEWFFAGAMHPKSWLNDQAITLYHLPDSSGRDLTLCYTVVTCAGFLPDDVQRYLALP